MSKALKLRYYHLPTRGCAILQIGRHLESKGVIAPLKQEKSIDRSREFIKLREPLRTIALEYFADLSKTNNATYGLYAIIVIRKWQDFLGRSTVEASEEEAKKFVAQLEGKSLEMRGAYIGRMKRFYDWLNKRGYNQTNPFQGIKHPRVSKACSKCGKTRVFFNESPVCHLCEAQAPRERKLKKFETESLKLEPYRRHLYGLFLRYVRRINIDTRHVHAARLLLDFFAEEKSIPVIKSWRQASELSVAFEAYASRRWGKTWRGGSVIKIGRVLQELSVLPIREEVFFDHVAEKKLSGLEPKFASQVLKYIELYRRGQRSERTIIQVVSGIKNFYDWLESKHGALPWSASEKMARDYLDHLGHPERVRNARQVLRRFYQWARRERFILSNPFEDVPDVKRRARLKVCAPEQIKKLEAFIRSPKSDPESAMILALIFYWGLTCQDLAMATVDIENEKIKVILHRARRTYQTNPYRRDQVLELPQTPPWLKSLSRRFIANWRERYKTVCADLPRQPLLLPRVRRHNRPMTTLAIRRNYYYPAIVKAVGTKVPANVLRRSGADVYAQQSAAAILPRMGWSRSHAFRFTWMPRQLYSVK